MKDFSILVLAVAVFAVCGAVLIKDTTVVVNQDGKNVGATPGDEHYNRQFNYAGSTDGGRLATTTTAATYTLTATDLKGAPTYWDILPNLNTTLSLSSTSTYEYVPNVGDVAKLYIRNASTTAAATITLAAVDAGIDLQKNEDTADLAINGLDWAELTLVRESASVVSVLIIETIEAD